jgi:hypothetical protein
MRPHLARALVLVAVALFTTACQGGLSMNGTTAQPVAGYVTDLPAFEQFVTLVLPGQIASKELRFNNSRYFAQLDDQNRITGGRFQ